MFLFICQTFSFAVSITRFKYILCSYLSIIIPFTEEHLLKFKYILCSYLSTVNSVFEIDSNYLNTSYVLIYHFWAGSLIQKTIFKYILCSYLSNVFTHFLFSIISYIALFFNISQLFYQPPPHFSFSSSLVSFPLIL